MRTLNFPMALDGLFHDVVYKMNRGEDEHEIAVFLEKRATKLIRQLEQEEHYNKKAVTR